MSWAPNNLEKKSGKKQWKLNGIPKLVDAHEAGGENAMKCTLILTQGDLTKALVVAGLDTIGCDYYGVFPIRSQPLNVREATSKHISDNAEINHLMKILGLQFDKKYVSESDMKSLRYGKVMMMTDRDENGSHIKGLLINFIHCKWPELLRQNFLEEFIIPIAKASKKQEVISFYSLPEFDEWKASTPNKKTYSIQFFKGLHSLTSQEFMEYFSNITRHSIQFKYGGQQDDDHIVLAFSKKQLKYRKEWVENFMVERKRRKEIGLPQRCLYTKDTKFVSYTDFVNLELVSFWYADNVRSIPSLVDGFKPIQRKVLFTCIKRNDMKLMEVGQLARNVPYTSAYHHNETDIASAIINLAQNFAGSNNINLLEPRRELVTRLTKKVAASTRYIFIKMSPITRLIFHPQDDLLLQHEYDNNVKVEPVWYIPIIPMILVNGADGDGFGCTTKIPNYNPRDLVANIKRMLDNEEPINMIPYYKNFKGTLESCGDFRYVCSGNIAVIGEGTLEITELPIGTWIDNYKENVLEPLLHGSDKQKPLISDYKEYYTESTVRFVVTTNDLEAIEKEGVHKVFRLQTYINTSSMYAFDEHGCLKRYESAVDILREFYALRLIFYQKRKEFLEGMLKAEASKLSSQARVIMEIYNGQMKGIVDELVPKMDSPDPVREWKARYQQEDEGEEEEEVKEEVKEEETDKEDEEIAGSTIRKLADKLLRQEAAKLEELKTVERKTPSQMWREDLDVFLKKYDALEKTERDSGHKHETKSGPLEKKRSMEDDDGGAGPSTKKQRIIKGEKYISSSGDSDDCKNIL